MFDLGDQILVLHLAFVYDLDSHLHASEVVLGL